MRHPVGVVRARFPVSPERYRTIALAALAALTAIVLTGAAVRLTDSGLGCPDWPRCYGKALPPLSFHSVVEYGNRVFSAVVGFVALGAFAASLLRTPRRRDLVLLSALLPLGCLGQAVLGGFTVRNHLAPGFVMAHFGLSMLILIAAVSLAWRASRPDVAPPPVARDALTVWVVRLAGVLGAAVLFVGTLATASGPHAGGDDGQLIHRLDFKGATTLVWVVHRHAVLATVLGLCVILAWFLARRRHGDARLVEALTVAGVLMAAQGLVGSIQYELALPADLVWIHVALATITWVALLWSVAVAGRLGRPAAAPPAPPTDLDAPAEHDLLRA
jgi:cytochrome c oxidase assembly protein subunit 15